jgi:hypothetical protein
LIGTGTTTILSLFIPKAFTRFSAWFLLTALILDALRKDNLASEYLILFRGLILRHLGSAISP